jgi:3-hydroxyisobutyrate dehydrogenase-like beta-hydroxyacid dehydrogenase
MPDSFFFFFSLKHMTKDIRFALQTTDENGATAPIGTPYSGSTARA